MNHKMKIGEIFESYISENTKPCHSHKEPDCPRSEGEDNLLLNKTKFRYGIGTLLNIALVATVISAAVHISRKTTKLMK